MRNRLQHLMIGPLVVLLLASVAFPQTLTESLVAEDPTQLAEQARRKGDVVRGAILFYQGNINCAKCHRPTDEKDRIGPNLTQIKEEVVDATIVESILMPSKVIKEGFETKIVLHSDGTVYSGLVIAENEHEIILGDAINLDQRIRISRKEIDEIQPGRKSSMPENLADELKNRQQFLDLLKYVFDLRERGPQKKLTIADRVESRVIDTRLQGISLLQQFNCQACHTQIVLPKNVVAKQAPRLSWTAQNTNPKFLEKFIARPHAAKPNATMPDVLGRLPDEQRREIAKAITHFLVNAKGNKFETSTIDSNAIPRGFELFHSVGCVACHSPRDQNSIELPIEAAVPMGDPSVKYDVEGLVEFLKNPHLSRPSGFMPNMQLTHREAIDIASFLLQSANRATSKFQVDTELANLGQKHFVAHDCAKCHSDFLASNQSSSLRTTEIQDPEAGCLSDRSGAWPDFNLTVHEQGLLREALGDLPTELSDQNAIDLTLHSFRCTSCHDRDRLGGVGDDRNRFFKTTNLNLGDQGRIPPTLTGVGAKLNQKWMRDVMVNGRAIRPYMKTRMPQFGEENIKHLFPLFQSCDQVSEPGFAKFRDQKEMRNKGLELAGNQGLNCVACHTYKYKPSDTMPAVDLTEMTERLKKDWFYQYMLTPQTFSPNTVMPSFWPNGVAIRKDIEGTPEDQIEALWQYLIDGRQARPPRGVVREPLEIVVGEEAQMLRRRYPGIGKRGIGVGYPGGVNIAYDAEQMRLGLIWKGKFADPVGVWTGQGHGMVRAMGKTISFANGPELDSRENPWLVDDGRPPNHQFGGYSLDEKRRPRFRYRFESIDIEDFFTEVLDEDSGVTHLSRQIKLVSTKDASGLRFRIATGKKIEVDENNAFLIDSRLVIRVVSDHKPEWVNVDNEMVLQLNFDLATEQVQNIKLDYFLK